MTWVGTDAYDKWLTRYRRIPNIYVGIDGKALDARFEYEIYMRVQRTPKEQEQALFKYKREQFRKGYEDIKKMIVTHKKVYYKEMETKQLMKRWKTFDEVSDFNDDMKEEIRKFL